MTKLKVTLCNHPSMLSNPDTEEDVPVPAQLQEHQYANTSSAPYESLLASPLHLQQTRRNRSRNEVSSGSHRRKSSRFEPFPRRGSVNRARTSKTASASFHRRQSGSHALQSKKALDRPGYLTPVQHDALDTDLVPDDYMNSPFLRNSRSPAPRHLARKKSLTPDGELTPLHYDCEPDAPRTTQQETMEWDLETPRQQPLKSERSLLRGTQRQTKHSHEPDDSWTTMFSSLCNIEPQDKETVRPRLHESRLSLATPPHNP